MAAALAGAAALLAGTLYVGQHQERSVDDQLDTEARQSLDAWRIGRAWSMKSSVERLRSMWASKVGKRTVGPGIRVVSDEDAAVLVEVEDVKAEGGGSSSLDCLYEPLLRGAMGLGDGEQEEVKEGEKRKRGEEGGERGVGC